MTRPALVQVVPQLPPAAGGVADYAAVLAHGLAEQSGIVTRFLVADPRWSTGAAPELAAALIAERRAGAFDRQLAGAAAILVHYANYGYAARGCPAWLVDGLRRWRARGGRTRLVTLFHEVYASGPPWRSSFWLSPVQRRLAAALARASDRVVTSLELYRDLLARWVPAEAVAVLPVFSTVGELASPAPLAVRRRRLVVFGGPGGRARAYGELAGALAAAATALGIAEIADVGPGLDGASPAAIAGVPVTRLGALSAAAVSALLAESLAGFVAHTPGFLGKSTVFAAYCSHGLLPVAACRAPGDARTWTPGANGDGEALQTTADAASAWYAGHSVSRQVEAFRGMLDAEGA